MKTAFVGIRSSVEVKDIPVPKVEPGTILVRMRACGLCGSDLEKIYGEYSMRSGRLGHEPAGEIVSIGGQVNDFREGDRVFVHHHVSCTSCYYCLHGSSTMCSRYQKSNIDPCGLSELFLVPQYNIERGGVLKLPSSLTYEAASFIEPLACCLRAINKTRIRFGDNITIFGAGPTGLMLAALARYRGAGNIALVDYNQFRLDFAKKFGDFEVLNAGDPMLMDTLHHLTEKRGVDIAIVATGNEAAFQNGLKITRKGGSILLFGVPSKHAKISLDLSSLYANELCIIPSYAASELETNLSLKILVEGRINMRGLVTHRYPIDKIAEAVREAHEALDAMKVLVIN
ncbi:MAG TPA: alcohol dehydrogenase catalytic domain-containing protein [Nitrososphaeraceae archaeon]|jgi:L-iditol 2-dehydrogenase